jgi:hypothetical protein
LRLLNDNTRVSRLKASGTRASIPVAHTSMCRRAAGGAYDTRKCHDAIAARNAHVVIPPRKNAKLWKSVTRRARARNEAELLSNLVFEDCWSCGVLVRVGGFNSIFKRDASDDFGKVVKAA